MLSLLKLEVGQRAIIKSINNEGLEARLIEMGCLPGEEVVLSRTAPLGCPFAIEVAGSALSLRREDAAAVQVELVTTT